MRQASALSEFGRKNIFLRIRLRIASESQRKFASDPNECERSGYFTYYRFSIRILIRFRQCGSDLESGSFKGSFCANITQEPLVLIGLPIVGVEGFPVPEKSRLAMFQKRR